MADGRKSGGDGEGRRLAAIARTAANLASQGSLPAILDALAAEVLQTDALAAVQILTLDAGGRQLRIMGSAGFGHWPDFFDRLLECRQRGAALRMIDSFRDQAPVLVPNRWAVIRDDPSWTPLRDYLAELAWESFASIPMMARGQAVGVLNAFFAPGQEMAPRTVESLAPCAVARVAQQGGVVDGDRRLVGHRGEELHGAGRHLLPRRASDVPAPAVLRIASEVGALSAAVLADLRAMVHELRPSSSDDLGGLEEAVRAFTESTANRTGLAFSVSAGPGLARVRGELADDVFRVIAEAIHNVVRHARAGKVTIRLTVRDDRLTATVADDGRGIQAGQPAGQPNAGFGLTTMRERAERWGGTVAVGPGRSAGTLVRVAVPLAEGAEGIPLRGAGSAGSAGGAGGAR